MSEEDTDLAYIQELTDDWRRAVRATEAERKRAELYRVTIGLIASFVSGRDDKLSRVIRREIATLHKRLRGEK